MRRAFLMEFKICRSMDVITHIYKLVSSYGLRKKKQKMNRIEKKGDTQKGKQTVLIVKP
jgi:hypoxanthine-guanine phosphoribosyltransferase